MDIPDRHNVKKTGGQDSPKQEPKEAIRPRPWRPQGKTILLAEDEEHLAFAYSILINNMGLRVVNAEDGTVALQKHKIHRQELAGIIMDATMPVMGGLEALAAIRIVDPHTPVLIISGLGEGHGANKAAMELGASYLAKPFSADDLAKAIRSMFKQGPAYKFPEL